MLSNPYLDEIHRNLPRLMSLFDIDRTSQSLGTGDRYYWAWGLIDFGNGTFQGAVHGMARLWQAGLWPYITSKDQFIGRISAIFAGAKWLTRNDGSLEEAFPNEGSYCVTALVAFDLLCAIDLLNAEVDEIQGKEWRATVAPLISYLIKADETHALISNHLATAVAALLRWNHLAEDKSAERKAHELLDRILDHQSEEGWFKEYEGFDPGYQSLCTYYLTDVHLLCPELGLLEPLRRSIQFLWHFAHPDGSFSGLYGSRCTRFYYPAGIEALADKIPEAMALSNFMAASIAQQRVVTLSAMDEPNLVPMFNAYAWGAVLKNSAHQRLNSVPPAPTLPCLSDQPQRMYFQEAGIWIDRGPSHFTIVNTHKGGVVYHFRQGKPVLIDAGVVIRNPKGYLGSTQAYAPNNVVKQHCDQLEITASIATMPKRLSSPLNFLILRALCLTVFRFFGFREWIKRLLVKLLITRRKYWPVHNRRSITLGETLKIEDNINLPLGYQPVSDVYYFVPIHMASQGYWQKQDEEPLQ